MVKPPPSNAGCVGSIYGQGIKIPHAAACGQKIFLIVFKILVALVFLAVHCLSLVAMSRVYSVLAAHGFLIVAEQGL